MTKTAKNSSNSASTPTPGGGGGGGGNPGSVAPPSVGSTKSEPGESLDHGGGSVDPAGVRSGTPHSHSSLQETNSNSIAANNPGSSTPGSVGAPGGNKNDESNASINGGEGLLCDNGPDAANSAGSVGMNPSGGGGTPDNIGGNLENSGGPASVGAHSKASGSQEDVKPSVSNCSTPMQNTSTSVINSETDFLDGFDSKDGGESTFVLFL